MRDLILAQVKAAQQSAGPAAALPIEEARGCVEVMNAVAPPLPPPGSLQCAGLLKLAADDVKRREGMSKTATDLITIAALLDDRARTELRAAGKTEAESDRDLTPAREAIAAKPETAPDMEACVELAQPWRSTRPFRSTTLPPRAPLRRAARLCGRAEFRSLDRFRSSRPPDRRASGPGGAAGGAQQSGRRA